VAQVLCVILDKVSAQEFGVGATHMLALPHYVLNVFVQTHSAMRADFSPVVHTHSGQNIRYIDG